MRQPRLSRLLQLRLDVTFKRALSVTNTVTLLPFVVKVVLVVMRRLS